jgi:hypothetical protein
MILSGVGWFLSMKQYFKIKAYKAGTNFSSILSEHSQKGSKYIFNSDFIEYFPLTYILRILGILEYNNLNVVLKKMYNKKTIYELLFWVSIIVCFIFVYIETGGKITSTY